MKEAPKLALLEADYSRGKWTLKHPECQDFIIEEKFLEFNESNKATGKVVDTKYLSYVLKRSLFTVHLITFFISTYRTQAIIKFEYSEKATQFCKISTLLLFYVVLVKSKVEIFQNFVAFSEYMNFT